MSNTLQQQLQTHFGRTYLLEREIGQGGMSRVFVAIETALDRRVVIKVLPPERVARLSFERFRREVAVTARLQHPHIVPILSTGVMDDVPYYAMPFIEGETLRDKLARDGRFPVAAMARVMRDVAEALECAHANGVVHRDIKPGNILLSGRSALVADFGIAKAVALSSVDPSHHLTSSISALGTPGYMAPEQAAGDDAIDHRVDLYSLGVVAYELLSGLTPFGVRSPAKLLAAHIVEQPRPIDAVRDDLPAALSELVMRCLAKDPADRPQSAAEVCAALDVVPHVANSTPPSLVREIAPTQSSIAVLPFTNLGVDRETDYLSIGITEAILNALARVPTLRVAARTSSFAFKGADADVQDVARKLRVSKVLTGSVRVLNERVRVWAQLVNTTDGFAIWAGQFDREWRDIFEIEDQISSAIVEALAIALTQPRATTVTRAGRRAPTDLGAYELYLHGRYFLDRRIEGMRKSMEYYERALERDPSYALGHAGVAEAHFLLTLYWAVTPHEGAPRARDAALRALALDPYVPDAHVVLANVSLWYDWDLDEARRQLDQAIALKPSDSLAHSCYAYYFASLGRTDDAIAQATHALAIDPLSLWVHSNLAVTLYLAGRYVESIERCWAIIELEPSYSEAYRWMALSHFRLREWSNAYTMMEKAVQLSGRHHWPLANLAAMLARAKKRDEARAILDELMERWRREAVPPLAIATVHYGLGDLDAVFEWLDRAHKARDFWLVMLREDPGFAELRKDPRFERFLERIVAQGVAESPTESLGIQPESRLTPR